MSWASNFHFDVTPKPEVSPWASGAIASQAVAIDTSFQNDENLKKLYGVELAKGSNPFEAAKTVLGENDKAVWASFNWLSDPVVLASRDVYLKTLQASVPPLDREQLAARVLTLAEGEKVNIDGVERPTIKATDRIAAFKLYAEIMQYTGKVEIDNSTKTFNTNNELKIVLVRPVDKKPTVIDQAPNVKSEIMNDKTPLPISLKLVKAG
jgi:hypothetical protein